MSRKKISMGKIFFDTETVSLHAVPVLLQWALDDGDVQLWNIWSEKMSATMSLIEYFMENTMIGFNVAFDAFHLCKIYTMFKMYTDLNGDGYPDGHIDELGMIEERARFLNICLKPYAVHDVMLHARKTKYQSLMERDDIKINRIPTQLAYQLTKELERRIPFDEIFFARVRDKSLPKWRIYDILRPDGSVNPDFKTIKLKFKASSGLKNLYKHAFGIKEEIFTYSDIEIGKEHYSDELGYAPYARAVAPNAPARWNNSWPARIKEHLAHWYHNENARKYAHDDVVYTRRLYQEEFNSPEPGDIDSTLAWMVAANRWHGYAIDIPAMKELKKQALLKLGFQEEMAETFKDLPVDQKTIYKFGSSVIAPAAAKRHILDAMNPTERIGFQGSTKKTVLEHIATWMDDDGQKHPAAKRAQDVLDAQDR